MAQMSNVEAHSVLPFMFTVGAVEPYPHLYYQEYHSPQVLGGTCVVFSGGRGTSSGYTHRYPNF